MLSTALSPPMTDHLEHAQSLDKDDPLREFRDRFWIPVRDDGSEQIYLCGNSLGLQPRKLAAAVMDELTAWQKRGVEGHFHGDPPWINYHELLREPMAELVGAKPCEVVTMNTLTVNLHLMLVSFYRPQGKRNRILIEAQAFPSDRYAVESQIRLHGLNPDDCLVELPSAEDSHTIEESAIEDYLASQGDHVALVLWPGVQYASGQFFDLARIAKAAKHAGANVGFDLAHAVGNVPLALHQSKADFAVWCTYKYLNAGPGAVGGCFVHHEHHGTNQLPRLNGWWGNALESRFLMAPEFAPAAGADAWAMSTPPLLSTVPITISLQLFQAAGFDRLRTKSIALTGYLEQLIRMSLADVIEILTPQDPLRRGCQLSLRMRAGRQAGRRLFDHLTAAGIITDWREPDIIRVAPAPLYNRFEDCRQFVRCVMEH